MQIFRDLHVILRYTNRLSEQTLYVFLFDL
jgi:hypothetical protein